MNSQYQHAYCQVSGTPFEQGVQQGQELSDAIRRNLASVHRKLEQEKVDLQAYQAFVNQNLRFFQEQRPEMYEELQGIAQGSGLPLDDILLLNIPAYFLCESFRHITQECSMLCVRGQAAADGCTYIIKNRDMGMPMEQALVRHIYPDGQEIIEVGGAGLHLSRCRHQQPWSGCDHHRLLDREGPHPHRPGGGGRYLPQCAGPPLLLQDRRPSGGDLPHRPRMNGLNVIAADPTEAYVIEMTSDEIYVEKDEGRGVLFRTNHVVSDQLSHFNPPEENYPSTHKRYDRIAQMVEERYGSLPVPGSLPHYVRPHQRAELYLPSSPRGRPRHHRFHHPLRGRGPRGVDYAAKSLSGPAPCPDRRALCTVSPLCQVLAPVRTVPSLYWFPISKNGQQKFC